MTTGPAYSMLDELPAAGQTVSTQEFAVYRVDRGKIAEVWVAANKLHLLDQLR